MTKKEPSYRIGGECELLQQPWKTVWRFLKKIKIELPYASAILVLGIYSEKILI